MGSFLMNCAVSKNVLSEGTPVMLVFVSRLVKNHDGEIASQDTFNDWFPETLMIKGIQEDYGYVSVDDDHIESMITLMVALATHSAEYKNEDSWKNYYKKEIGSPEKLQTMTPDNISEHFNHLMTILHNNGILYRSSVQGTISMMKVAHVDMVVVDSIINSPAEISSYRMKYDNAANYNRTILRNMNDYIDYLLVSNKDKFEKYISSEYVNPLENFLKGDSSEHNYHALFPSFSPSNFGCKIKTVEEVVDMFVFNRMDEIFLSYSRLLGCSFSPSNYAGQDYSGMISKNYRNLMTQVFLKQKENSFQKTLEDNFENGEDIQGNSLPADVEEQEYFKNSSKAKELFMNQSEVDISEKNLIICDNLDGVDFARQFQSSN